MKVTWLINQINQVGGIEQVVCGLSNFFSDRMNIQVEIISINSVENHIQFPLSDTVSVRHCGMSTDTQTRTSLVRMLPDMLRKLDSDFLITCHPGISNAVLLNKRFFKGKVIVTEHSSYMQYTKKRALLNVAMFRFADHFLVLNSFEQRWYHKWGCKASVMPNAIFNPSPKCSTLDSKRVISIGRLTQVKGFDRLLRAFAIASRSYPDWQLCICGDGEEQQALYELAKTLEIDNRVIFPGFVNNVPDYLLDSSIFALSSRTEGFSLALVDAISHGLPVISFALPPVYEMLGKSAAMIVPQDDIENFARCLCSLMASKELRQSYGQKSFERSLQYSLPTIGQCWLDLFMQLRD